MNRNTVVILASVMVVSCGGSSGGGVSQDPGANSVDPIDENEITPITGSFGCAVTLDQAFLDNLETLGSESLDNLTTGCDYFAPESIALNDINSIEAGVSIALGDGVNLDFNNRSLDIIGTADAPIVFQAKDAANPWGSISISANSFSIDYALFSGGGQSGSVEAAAYSPETYTEAAVYIDFTGTGVSSGSVTNSSFTSSESAGVLLGHRVGFDAFSQNHFENNSSYSMILESTSGEVIINEMPSQSFAGTSIQPVLVNSDSFISSFSGEQLQFSDVGVPYMFINLTQSRSITFGSILFRAGVESWFAPDSGLSGNTLFVLGESENPVTFKGLPDSENEWSGVSIGKASVMRHFEIIGGGLGQNTDGASLHLDGTSANKPLISDAFIIEYGSIENSQGVGLKCESNSSVYTKNISNISIENAAFGLVDPACDITSNEISPTAEAAVEEVVAYDAYAAHAGDCSSIIFDQRIQTPITLENSDSECDYLFIGDNEFTSNVTIEAGTTLVFERAASLELDVVRAVGTAEEPIVLRGNSGVAGYWNGVSVFGNGSILSYVSVLDAGAIEGSYSISTASDDGIERQLSNAISLEAHAIQFTGLSTTMTNSTIDRSEGAGLFSGADATFSELSDNTISNVGGFAAFVSPENVSMLAEGVEIDPSQPSLVGNGVYVSGREFTSSYRTVYSTFFSNLAEYVRVDGEMQLRDIGVPWVFPNLELRGSMIVDPGADLRLIYSIELNSSTANLAINGTTLEPVTLSGMRDDPTNKLWSGIDVGSGSVSIDNANLQGADVGLFLSTNGGAVTISDSTISDGESGIVCSSFYAGQLSLTNTDISNMTERNIGAECPL